MITFLNGCFIEDHEAHIAPSDRGLTLGDGVFDTMLALDGAPVMARAHFERLLRHADVLRLNCPLSAGEIEESSRLLLHKNNYKTGRFAVRTTITRGSAARGLAPDPSSAPTFLMRATAAPAADPSAPLNVAISKITRRNEHSPLSRIKSVQYGDNLLALMEARDRGAQDAILLNTRNHACCAATGNLFILEQGVLVTPPLSDGVLDGITRSGIIKEYPVREDHITEDRLRRAQGLFLTNSLSGIRAVHSLDGVTLPVRSFPTRDAA